MFTKTEVRTALNLALDINRDDTNRECCFSYVNPSCITISIYPKGKLDDLENSWIWTAFHTGPFICYERIRQHGIFQKKQFPSLKELLRDVKEAAI